MKQPQVRAVYLFSQQSPVTEDFFQIFCCCCFNTASLTHYKVCIISVCGSCDFLRLLPGGTVECDVSNSAAALIKSLWRRASTS